jgi:hypothetical protein
LDNEVQPRQEAQIDAKLLKGVMMDNTRMPTLLQMMAMLIDVMLMTAINKDATMVPQSPNG